MLPRSTKLRSVNGEAIWFHHQHAQGCTRYIGRIAPAICEGAPFREWIVDSFAIDVIKKTVELRGGKLVIVHGPIVYYADATAKKAVSPFGQSPAAGAGRHLPATGILVEYTRGGTDDTCTA